MIRYLVIGALVCAMPYAARAQDYSAPALDPYMAGMQGALIQGTRKPVNRANPRANENATTSPSEARAICANRFSARSQAVAHMPAYQRLDRLCKANGW